jgi:predicted ATPase
MLKGWAVAVGGRPEEGYRLAEEGLSETRHSGFGRLSFQLGLMAELHCLVGDTASALKLLKEAIELTETTGERRWRSLLLHKKGLALAGDNDLQSAEEALRSALVAAREQETHSLELRAATGLAQLWQRRSRRAAARELLAPVYGWFTEGFDTADLKEAKAVLDELA